MNRKKIFFSALRTTFPVMLGYVIAGLAMGVLAQKQGFPWWLVLLMSLILFAGSAQFLAVELIAGMASFPQIAILTFLLNMRHIVYGLSLLDRYRLDWIHAKPYMIHSLTDETYALHLQNATPDAKKRGLFDLYVSLIDHSYWTLGTTAGAIAGTLLPFELRGLDFALSALFIVTAVEQWLTADSKLPAVIGFACAIVSLILFGAQHFLMPAVGVTIVLLFACYRPIRAKLRANETEEDAS